MSFKDELQCTSGVIGLYKIAGNAPSDPTLTSSNIQPRFWDQIFAVYERYVCLGSSIKCTFFPDVTSAEPVFVGITPRAVDIAPTDPVYDLEDGYSRITCLSGGSITAQPKTLKMFRKSKRMFGIPASQVQDGKYQGNEGTNPTTEWWYWLTARPHNGGTTVAIPFVCTMTFYCVFFNKTWPNTSVDE